MRPARWTTLLALLLCGGAALWLLRHGLRARHIALPAAAMQGEPLTMLWAWETPEDLRALDPQRAGVAYLSREIGLRREIGLGTSIVVTPRRQPLQLAPGTWLMAVVRIDSPHGIVPSTDLRRQTLAAILPAIQQPDVRALQIDFDATGSQLPFYAALLRDLRRALPPAMPLSITALTSWCGPRSWLPSLDNSVAEAVPMFFRMGGTPATRAALPKDASVVTQPLCAGSVGVATDEPWPALHPRERQSDERVYIFRTGPWTAEDLHRLNTAGAAALAPENHP